MHLIRNSLFVLRLKQVAVLDNPLSACEIVPVIDNGPVPCKDLWRGTASSKSQNAVTAATLGQPREYKLKWSKAQRSKAKQRVGTVVSEDLYQCFGTGSRGSRRPPRRLVDDQ
eukprot:810346-Rhodomonas_salina.1